MRTTSAFAAIFVALGSATALAQLPAPAPKGVPVPATTIVSATPSSLGLVINGPAQIVALNGTLLDRIASASVERNGVPLNYVVETVQPAARPTYREIHLTAVAGAQVSTSPAELIIKGRFSGAAIMQTMKVPVTLHVVGRSALVHRDALFAAPINALLAGANTSFTSCGTPSLHVFAVKLPKVSYSANGGVPRLERVVTSVGDRASFLADHSLNPTNAFDVTKLANLTVNAHPSPFPHSISEVRMCLEPYVRTNNWTFTSASETGGSADVTIAVRYGTATFRALGMPSDPTGLITGINVNILWGNAIPDAELPDFRYLNPEFDVRLPLKISSGDVTYGSVQVTPRFPSASWAHKFLGPASIRTLMEQYAASRMTDIEQEIRKAFEAPATRNAISAAIMAGLQSAHGIADVLALRISKGDVWDVQY
jgi:hypothetical protein